MLEILLPKFNAELYFYIPLKTVFNTNFFITKDYINTAATNTMKGQLVLKREYEDIAFMCRTTEENHNNIKKCIEYALYEIQKHLIIIGELPAITGEPKSLPTPKQSNDGFVDLTDENDSEDEECHAQQIREVDEEYLLDYLTNDIEINETEIEMARVAIANCDDFHNWMISLPEKPLEVDEDLQNESLKIDKEDMEWIADHEGPLTPIRYANIFINFRAELYGSPIRPILQQAIDKNFKIKDEKKEEKPLSFSSTAHPKKLSFSSISHPQVTRKAIEVSPHRETPKSHSYIQPQLNRGIDGNIELNAPNVTTRRKIPAPPPKSKILSPKAVQKYYDAKNERQKLPEILRRERDLQKEFSSSFTIPRKRNDSDSSSHSASNSVLEDDYDPSRGAQPRRKLHDDSHDNSRNTSQSNRSNVTYTERKKPLNVGHLNVFMNKVKLLEPISESPRNAQADRQTPTSVKVFFDGATYPEYKKESTTNNQAINVSDEEDDDVMLVDENKNIRSNRHSSDEQQNERSENKFFKTRRSDAHQNRSVHPYTRSRIPKPDKKYSELSHGFWNRYPKME